MNFGQLLHSKASEHPQKAAVICGDESITYQALHESSTRLAAWLLDQGLQPGDRAAIHWPNSIPTVQLFFAMFKAGVIAVPVNLRLKRAEIVHVLRHAGARMCFSAPPLAPLAQQAAAECPNLAVLSELPQAPSSRSLTETDPDQPAVILYTSGTTAQPKGVVHSQRSLLEGIPALTAEFYEDAQVTLTMTSFMHASALCAILVPTIYTGTTMVALPVFDPAAVLDAIERYRVAFSISMPALVQFVVDEQLRQPRDVS